jgi:signal recognition particle GTPase
MAELTLEQVQALIDQKLAEQRTSLTKEFDIRENKIHASYAKKFKQDAPVEDDTSDTEPRRRLSKSEVEANQNVEKLVKMLESERSATRLANFKNTLTDHLLKNGINPEAVDTVYTVMKAKNAFVDDGENGFRVKVNVEGQELPLSPESAVKHYVSSPEAKFFLAPKGAAGTGAAKVVSNPGTNSSSNSSDIRQKLSPENVAKSLGIDLKDFAKAI